MKIKVFSKISPCCGKPILSAPGAGAGSAGYDAVMKLKFVNLGHFSIAGTKY